MRPVRRRRDLPQVFREVGGGYFAADALVRRARLEVCEGRGDGNCGNLRGGISLLDFGEAYWEVG